MPDTLCLLVCAITRPEMDAVLAEAGWDDVVARSFPACCGVPALGAEKIEALTADINDLTRTEVLGSSCLCKLNPGRHNSVHIRRLTQCFELFAPTDLVTKHLEAGAYLLTPGWLRDWQSHFTEWGFDRTQARSFFKQFASQLVLLDTGIDADASEHLRAFASFVSRPHTVEHVGLQTLRALLSAIVAGWHTGRPCGTVPELCTSKTQRPTRSTWSQPG
ncbi:MAG: DUF1638 domain-containing protein [Kiritimatiellia bacterium]|jgi:hypothetical protein|nr:DUF1638 domain-containing protein [Kiritimatiellia bacterium]MDP6809162.1 DUF1638 domain-containing protein [Kiritimatiellia bacterium]